MFDASPVITACKFEIEGKLVVDYLLEGCGVAIAPSVEEEVAILGASYPDGAVAGQRIATGSIQVIPLVGQRWPRRLASYALGAGERESIELCGQLGDAEAFVTDDYLAFVAATRLGIRVWMLPDLVAELGERGLLLRSTARAILQTIRGRYRAGVIEHSLAQIDEGGLPC